MIAWALILGFFALVFGLLYLAWKKGK